MNGLAAVRVSESEMGAYDHFDHNHVNHNEDPWLRTPREILGLDCR